MMNPQQRYSQVSGYGPSNPSQYSLANQQVPLGVQQGGPQGPQAASALGRFGGTNGIPPTGQIPPQQRGVPMGGRYPNMSGMTTANNTNALRSSLGSQQIQMPNSASVGVPNQNPNPNQGYNPSAEILGLLQPKGGNYQTPNGTIPNSMGSLRDSSGIPHSSSPNMLQMSGSMHNPLLDNNLGVSNYDMMDYPVNATNGGRPIVNMAKQNENTQEFNLGGEDFPALPGAAYPSKKSSNVDGSERSMRTSPTSGSELSNQQQQEEHAHYQPNLSSSGGIPYGKASPNMMAAQQQQQQQMGSTYLNTLQGDPDLAGLRLNNPNNPSLSQYEQFLPQLRQQQQQQPKTFNDRFSLLGLLGVIRMTEPDLNTLALGTDLTTLGLNLNSPDPLYSTFGSPWADGPSRREPEFYIPMCYYLQEPFQSPVFDTNLFSEETLFYIFYSMPKDLMQVSAAAELFKREWRFHKELKVWLTRVPGTEASAKTATYERGSYIYFDVNSWEKIRKDNFVLSYDQLETSPPAVGAQQQRVFNSHLAHSSTPSTISSLLSD